MEGCGHVAARKTHWSGANPLHKRKHWPVKRFLAEFPLEVVCFTSWSMIYADGALQECTFRLIQPAHENNSFLRLSHYAIHKFHSRLLFGSPARYCLYVCLLFIWSHLSQASVKSINNRKSFCLSKELTKRKMKTFLPADVKICK